MDKKQPITNGRHNNNSHGNRKPHTAEKASKSSDTATTLNSKGQANHQGLLQVGTPTSAPSQKGSNSNGNRQKSGGKKSKKNTNHGSGSGSASGPKSTGSGSGSKSAANGSAAAAAAPSEKSGPVLLGMPDTPMDSQEDTDPYVTKIGGVPSWLDQDLPAPSKYGVCEACGKSMYLLLQAYVPLEKSPYDRVVYVWACNQRLCMRKKGSFRVVRALKLNPEYAQKLEKKSKPSTLQQASVSSSSTTTTTPIIGGANPFAASGAFEMSNALFGGSGSGFANPFAPPSSAASPFAPPSGFGVGLSTPTSASAPPGVKSFASITAKNIPQDEESSESEEEGSNTVEESTEWSEDLPAFGPHYLYITEETLDNPNAMDDDISERYSHLLALEQGINNDGDDQDDLDCDDTNDASGSKGLGGATWSGEAYEKATLPKGVDKAFKKFTERVQSWPDQCVRYDFPGTPLLFSWSDRTAQLLLPTNASQHSKHTTPSPHRIPRCPACKGPRGFEFQLMPNLLSLLDVTSKKYLSEEEMTSLKDRKGAQMFDIGMEWGTILVYSCVDDCFGKTARALTDRDQNSGGATSQKVKYFEEVALVQFED
ncbi:hypothetical protein BGX34_008595 [Mortierella sp. NVP85]|nr:hypothetical protein BGX34_008595 [Mortierella sp. NVP85]